MSDHSRLLREAFTAQSGEVIDTQGDSFLVAFRTSVDAVAAAVAAQLAIAAFEWPVEGGLQVRMGIHTGEATVASERYPGSRGSSSLAHRRGWVPANPVRGLTRGERSSSRKRSHRVLSSAEIRAVLDKAGKEWKPLVAVAVFCGLRQSELLGLTWADVDADGRRLHVRSQLARGSKGRPRERVETKTEDAVRTVSLPVFVAKMLAAHRLASAKSLDEHPVFGTVNGLTLDHRNVVTAWHRIRLAAKLAEPLPRFHDLRHTAASLWISEGADVGYVSRVLGHSSASITLDVYADLFDREKHAERATAALDAAFGGGA